MSAGVTVLAPAKINLCLSVLGRRPDGYHDVDMLMQMVGIYDEVRVEPGGTGITVTCNAASVPAGPDNIAWKAADAFLKQSGFRQQGVVITIRKAIPVAAGLGGGSSDAAAVLSAMNSLLGAGLDRSALAAIGAGIGMDVPFFFHGPLALARGRGELVTSRPPLPSFWVLLVNPGFETSTAWAYQNLNLRLTKKVDCTKIAGLSVREIAGCLHNDLETVTAAAHPLIRTMEEALQAQGALGACMSGSGPTVFGIFETEESCRAAAGAINGRGWRIFPAEALTASPLEVYHTVG
jgi:4-diphosphocytidyl-2-C-methyl-D-erythritol kinase